MNEEIKVLDLFSGIGGFSYSAHLANRGSIGPLFRTSAFVERDQFCQRVLRKHWPDVPIFDDVTTLNADRLGRINMVTAGFPCQPASVAGARKGREDDRWLWPEIIRIVQCTQPTWLLLENVRGLLTLEGGMVFEDCIADLETAGYESQTFIIPACAVDSAPHRRDRVWIVAHSRCSLQSRSKLREKNENETREWNADQSKRPSGPSESDVADTANNGRSIFKHERKQQGQNEERKASDDLAYSKRYGDRWAVEPEFCRMDDGVSRRLDEAGRHAGWENGEPQGMQRVSIGVKDRAARLRSLGNSIVPQVAEQIFRAILESERQNER